MLSKILSLLLLPLALLISAFSTPVDFPDMPEKIIEEEPVMNDKCYSDKIDGYNLTFYIVRPDPSKLERIGSSSFGMSPSLEDNTEQFISAAEYCRENPGTELVIEEGTYYFSESGRIVLRDIDTCFIDGSKAKFIFRKPGSFIGVNHCRNLEINGLAIDVDRVNDPVDDVLRIQNADKKNNTLEFLFFEKEEINENMILSAITQCDPETLTFGAERSSKENYIYMNPDIIKKVEKTAPNVLKITHDGAFGNFESGDTFILRHHVYDGQVFSMYGESSDITFDGVKIYGSYGSGYGASDLTSHYQIINSFIGVDPDDTTGAHVSQGADGIHLCGTGGFFNLENCDISGQGDDAMNIHDGIGYVYEVNGNRIKMYSTQTRLNEGEYLAFKDSGFNEKGYEAKIVSFGPTGDVSTAKEITFDCDVTGKIEPGDIAYNTATDSGNYVIRNNCFHENRARGLLLQSDNGLCENNRFYKIQGQAIKIVMDIRPTLWQEGTGVNGMIVRGNTFEKCDYSGWGEQITIDSYIDGHYADAYAFRNIEITGNTFKDFPLRLINAMNVNGLKVTGNRVDASDGENYIKLNDYCANVTVDNEYTGKYADTASIVRAESPADFIMINSSAE